MFIIILLYVYIRFYIYIYHYTYIYIHIVCVRVCVYQKVEKFCRGAAGSLPGSIQTGTDNTHLQAPGTAILDKVPLGCETTGRSDVETQTAYHILSIWEYWKHFKTRMWLCAWRSLKYPIHIGQLQISAVNSIKVASFITFRFAFHCLSSLSCFLIPAVSCVFPQLPLLAGLQQQSCSSFDTISW